MALANQFHRLRYFVSDAWDEWRHSLGVNMMALATLVAALFLAGIVLLVVNNIDRRVNALREDVRVEIYLVDDLDEQQRVALTGELRQLPDVERVEYVDKAEALRRYREWAADLAQLVQELESNPLPASLEVFIASGPSAVDSAAAISEALSGRAGIEEVRFNRGWLEQLESLLQLARTGGGAFLGLVLFSVVCVMGSVLRLAVFARREEIEIMQLVGATPMFIRGPYLVAGALQGLLAAGLSLGLVEAVRRTAVAWGGGGAHPLSELLVGQPLASMAMLLVVFLGLIVAMVGSFVSVRLR